MINAFDFRTDDMHVSHCHGESREGICIFVDLADTGVLKLSFISVED